MKDGYPRFEYWKTGSQWYWHLQSGNGRIVGSGSGFDNEDGVKDAINTFYDNVIKAGKNGMTKVDSPSK